jgi:hypothetical protein
MDVETRLRNLESRYRAVSNAAAAAKAHYLALCEPNAAPAAVERAKLALRRLEIRKKALAAQMGELEDSEQDFVA